MNVCVQFNSFLCTLEGLGDITLLDVRNNFLLSELEMEKLKKEIQVQRELEQAMEVRDIEQLSRERERGKRLRCLCVSLCDASLSDSSVCCGYS